MAKTTAIGVVLAALLLGAQAKFTKPCAENFDICGWALQATYGKFCHPR
jgi:hypothetical protein